MDLGNYCPTCKVRYYDPEGEPIDYCGCGKKVNHKPLCPIHGKDCPGDDGGFFMDGNHPDDMFGIHAMKRSNK